MRGIHELSERNATTELNGVTEYFGDPSAKRAALRNAHPVRNSSKRPRPDRFIRPPPIAVWGKRYLDTDSIASRCGRLI